MDIITFINSLTNEDLNRIRNSKSDAEARRLLREHQALQLLQMFKEPYNHKHIWNNDVCEICNAMKFG
jgi:hypothetical protein